MEWTGLEYNPVTGFCIGGIELYCSAVRGLISKIALRVTGCEDGRMGGDWNWVRIVPTGGCWSQQC